MDDIEIIEKNMKDLKVTMEMLNTLINDQRNSFETIEDFISESKKESIKGENDLKDALKFEESSYKSYVSYIIGGLSLLTLFFYM